MNPIDPPPIHGPPLGTAGFKSQLEDFQVEEVLGFEPSGAGEHCCLWIEKCDVNTNDVATALAAKLGLRKRLVSHCGRKDKQAVTRQWFSIHLPGKPSPTPADFGLPGVRVLKITRNLRKLHRGGHDANRFVIRLRNCCFSAKHFDDRWAAIVHRGVPNYFGPQRFGRDGRNVEQATKMFQGEYEPRDRQLRGILISAARSALFNACVAARVERGTWDTCLPGDVFGFANNRSLVLPGNRRGDEELRVKDGALEITAPLWGEGELQSQDVVRALEAQVATKHAELIAGLAQFNLKQERRVVRLRPTQVAAKWEDDSTCVLRFQLPKGTYATTVLRELIQAVMPAGGSATTSG